MSTALRDISHGAEPTVLLQFLCLADGIRYRDFGFALRAAQRANELTANKNAPLLDTLARVHFERGAQLDRARARLNLDAEHRRAGRRRRRA